MQVQEMKRRPAMTYDRPGHSAKLVDGSLTLRVSRYDDEPAGRWIVDGLWPTSSPWPAFWNGEGSRCTLLKQVGDAEAVRLLDEAAAALGVPCPGCRNPMMPPAPRGEAGDDSHYCEPCGDAWALDLSRKVL
jgi:hypothetical protein